MEHVIPLRDGELEKIMIDSIGKYHVDVAFGTGGVAFKWNDEEPMPKALEFLGLLRGVLNENLNGAGI